MNLEIVGQKVLIHTTEKTIREFYNEILQFKENNPGKEYLLITSPYSVIKFEVHLEAIPHTQESLGFRAESELRKERKD